MNRILPFALFLATAAPALADTAYVNANGYTIDDQGAVARFATLIVDDSGRVKATLPAGAPVAVKKKVDVGGKTMMPGLIDAHGHIMMLGELALRVDLNTTQSLGAAQAAIKGYKSQGPWILGGGWNQERWTSDGKAFGRFPTAAELDAVTGSKPAYLERVDGHAAWVNTRALQLAGITAATPDPAGGRIERNASGAPTGVLVDAAMDLVRAKIPPATKAQADKALTTALGIIASVGLTSVHDAGIDPEMWDRYRRFAAQGKLTTRVYAMAYGPENRDKIAPQGPIKWDPSDRLAMMSMKLQADGALGSRGAWMRAPYSDAPETRGLPFFEEGAFRRIILESSGKGFQTNVHAIGDAANGATIGAFAAVPEAQRKALRHRDEHAQIVSTDDLIRFARLGIIVSFQPTHATSDKGMAEARVGEARLAGGYAWQTILRSGARIAAGSDFPVEPPNPFYGLHAAVTRQDRNGQPPGGWRASEALTLPQALAAFTTGAAYAAHAEDRLGSLTPGKWADFIIVDRDPFGIPAAELWQVGVEQTYVAGKPVFRKKR
jgi:predicted amidohydrolase YtcJ